MVVTDFVPLYLPTAVVVKAGTGLDETTLLAQWAHETGRLFNPEPGWAGSPNNLANIRDTPGSFAQYASLAEFADAYIWTMQNSRPNPFLPVSASNNYYWPVMATKGQAIELQLTALGASAWDSGHYNNGGGFGSALFGYAREIDMFNDNDRRLLTELNAAYNQGPAGYKPGGAWHDYVTAARDHFDAEIKAATAAATAAQVAADAAKASADAAAASAADAVARLKAGLKSN